MQLCVSGWTFLVDYEATALYSRQELAENCQCEKCCHFYKHVDQMYPSLRPFLQSFGVELFAPESLDFFYEDLHICCSLAYLVYGEIQEVGTTAIVEDGIYITAELDDDGAFYLTFDIALPVL